MAPLVGLLKRSFMTLQRNFCPSLMTWWRAHWTLELCLILTLIIEPKFSLVLLTPVLSPLYWISNLVELCSPLRSTRWGCEVWCNTGSTWLPRDVSRECRFECGAGTGTETCLSEDQPHVQHRCRSTKVNRQVIVWGISSLPLTSDNWKSSDQDSTRHELASWRAILTKSRMGMPSQPTSILLVQTPDGAPWKSGCCGRPTNHEHCLCGQRNSQQP